MSQMEFYSSRRWCLNMESYRVIPETFGDTHIPAPRNQSNIPYRSPWNWSQRLSIWVITFQVMRQPYCGSNGSNSYYAHLFMSRLLEWKSDGVRVKVASDKIYPHCTCRRPIPVYRLMEGPWGLHSDVE